MIPGMVPGMLLRYGTRYGPPGMVHGFVVFVVCGCLSDQDSNLMIKTKERLSNTSGEPFITLVSMATGGPETPWRNTAKPSCTAAILHLIWHSRRLPIHGRSGGGGEWLVGGRGRGGCGGGGCGRARKVVQVRALIDFRLSERNACAPPLSGLCETEVSN